jgi:hypothetical protein
MIKAFDIWNADTMRKNANPHIHNSIKGVEGK